MHGHGADACLSGILDTVAIGVDPQIVADDRGRRIGSRIREVKRQVLAARRQRRDDAGIRCATGADQGQPGGYGEVNDVHPVATRR